MKIKYLGGSPEISIAKEFKERRKYLKEIREMNVPVIDTLYEQRLYGQLDNSGHVVIPTSPAVSFGEYATSVTGLGYVVELFNSFRDFYFHIASNNDIEIPKEIEELVPTKSYVNTDEEFVVNKERVSDILYGLVSDRTNGHPIGMLEFSEIVNEALFSEEMENLKVTKSGFALTDCYLTGLYVDMSRNYSTHTDQAKGDLIHDPNFKCYCDFAESHGFLVDINAPWRLVLNMDSPITRKNILNGRPESEFFNLYSDMYSVKVGYDDYWEIKRFYESLYNEYSRSAASQPSRLRPNMSVARLEENMIDTNDINWKSKMWIKCLITNKFREMGLMASPDSTPFFDEVYAKSIDMLDNHGIHSKTSTGLLTNPSGPIGYINQVCSKVMTEMLRK